jgi:outer membrane receptor protein involved in Fe transport
VSPQSLNLLKLLPAPNAPGISNNYSAGGTGVLNNNQFDVRVDDQVKEKIHAFSRYSYFGNKISVPVILGAAAGQGFSPNGGSFGGSATARNQSAVAGADILINPKLTTDFRAGYLRYHVATSKDDSTEAFDTNNGIPGLNTSNPFTLGAKAFYVNGISNFGAGLQVNACSCSLLETEDQFQLVNNWTRTLGNHSLKAGADFRYGRNLRVPSDSNRAGELTFATSDTENVNASTAGGLGPATFLLGDVTSFGRYVSSSTGAKEFQKRDFFYAKDTWRVTPNLTVDYGLRWDIYFPESVNGKGNCGFADLTTGTIRVAGVDPYKSNMNVANSLKNFAPRVGIAYQVHPTTVVRASYGRSFDMGVFGSVFGHVVTQNLPVLAAQSLNNSGPNTSVFSLANGPEAFAFPTIPSTGVLPITPGLNAKIRQDPNRFPTIDAWNLAVQQEMGKSLSVTIAYVGNKGSHTFAGDGQTSNPNQPAACLTAAQAGAAPLLGFGPGAGQTRNIA